MEAKKENKVVCLGVAEWSDLTLVLDKTEFRVHKIILAQHSRVWKNMLHPDPGSGDNREQNRFDLTDRSFHETSVLQVILDEIYSPIPTGQITCKNVEQILALAHFYDMPCILHRCDPIVVAMFPAMQNHRNGHENVYASSSPDVTLRLFVQLAAKYDLPLSIAKGLEQLGTPNQLKLVHIKVEKDFWRTTMESLTPRACRLLCESLVK